MASGPIAHDILVFGRSSDPTSKNRRQLSEMGKFRVDAAFHYFRQHQAEFTHTVRIQFSCGWAAGEGMKKPSYVDREAVLMDRYADEKGYKTSPNLLTSIQTESYSTVSDAVLSAQSKFFGSPPFHYSSNNPLGIVAQSGQAVGENNIGGHMVRCFEAAHKAFHIPSHALLPIIAIGDDKPRSALSESQVLRLTKIFYFGTRSNWDLLWRDRFLLFLVNNVVFRH